MSATSESNSVAEDATVSEESPFGEHEAKEASLRFNPDVVRDFERSGEGRMLIRSFFLFSLFYMWPYQTMAQMQSFLEGEFPEERHTVGFVMMMCATWPMFLTHMLLSCTGLSRRMTYAAKVVAPCALVASLSVYLFFLMRRAASIEPKVLLYSLYIAALLGSIAESFTEPAIYDMAGLFPSALTSQMVQAGNGACGLIVSLVQIGTRLVFNGLGPMDKGQLEGLTTIFIILMGGASAAIVAIYVLLVRRTQSYIAYVKASPQAPKGHEKVALADEASSAENADALGLTAAGIEAVRHVWPSFLALALTFATTLTLWPVIPGQSCAELPGGDGTLQSWWFTIVILAFNLADFVGKVERKTLRWGARVLSPAMQLTLAIARIAIFVPVILSSCAPQVYPTEYARCITLAATFLLGLSNGWLSTVCFMRAPKALPPGTPNIVAEQASTVLVIGLFLGISSGCLVAYLLGKTVLKDSLGVCYGVGV